MDGIHQYNRVITLQRTVQPLLHIGAQVVNHARNAGFAVMLTVNLTEDLADLPLGQTPAIKAAGQTFALQFLVTQQDRKSTRLNSSHVRISYAVFCLKKKKE